MTVRTVENKLGTVQIFVSEHGGPLPVNYMLIATTAKTKVALRIAGGCKNMTPQDKLAMFDFFSLALEGYSGVLSSGGTRQLTKDGELDPMVTDIPGYIAHKNDGVVALGTVPRTGVLNLQGESVFVLDNHGTLLNPTMDAILLVQDGPDVALDWDGDILTYLKIMESWNKFAGFTKVGLISWNGGAITEAEFKATASRKWPTFLIEGSGRATDDAIQAIKKGTPDALIGDHIYIVNKSDPMLLRTHLINTGFII